MAKIPSTGQDEWAAEQGTPWVQVNLAFRALAAYAVGLIVQSRSLDDAPATCLDGDCFLVGASPTGDWAAFFHNDIAVALGNNAINGWAVIPAASVQRDGVKIFVVDEGTSTRWFGSWFDGMDVFVDTAGAPDGGTVRWDASNGIFYIG